MLLTFYFYHKKKKHKGVSSIFEKKLDPEIAHFLQHIPSVAAPLLPIMDHDIQRGRQEYRIFCHMHAGEGPPLHNVENITIPSFDKELIPARIYHPLRNPQRAGLLYFHGGGWQRGDLDTHDTICRYLAHGACCTVVSVGWRLAPEHPFPAGLYDAKAAFQWFTGQKSRLRVSKIGVAGDSAGGNIAAALCLLLQETKEGGYPHMQCLIYPCLDLSCSLDSHNTFGRGFLLTTEKIKTYIAHYIPKEGSVDNPLCSPLKAASLKGLPTSYIVTCGFDPLVEDGLFYAKKLEEVGVSTTYHCFESLIHASFHMTKTVPAARNALESISIHIGRMFETQ